MYKVRNYEGVPSSMSMGRRGRRTKTIARTAFTAIAAMALLPLTFQGAVASGGVLAGSNGLSLSGCIVSPTDVVCTGNLFGGFNVGNVNLSYVNTGHTSLTVSNLASGIIVPIRMEQSGPVQVNVSAAGYQISDIIAKSTGGAIVVDCSGSIKVSDIGIYTLSSAAAATTITHVGNITSTDPTRNAIRAWNTGQGSVSINVNGAISGGVINAETNSGDLSISLAGSNSGMNVSSTSGNISVTIAGNSREFTQGDFTTMVTAGTGSAYLAHTGSMVINGSYPSNAVQVVADSDVTVVNSGSIVVTGLNTNAIRAASASSGDPAVSGTGHVAVTNAGTISVSGVNAVSVYATSISGRVTVSNSGTITASGAGAGGSGSAAAIYVDSNLATVPITVTNNGILSAAAGAYAIKGGTGNITATNNGRIDGAVFLNGQSSTFTNARGATFTGDYDSRIGSDTISNSGKFTDNVSTAASNTGAINTGAAFSNSFTNTETGIFNSGPTVNLGGGTLTNAGIMSPGGSGVPSTTTVTGNYVQSATGRLAIDADWISGQSDKLAISGTAKLAGTVFVNPLNFPTTAASGLTRTFTIVTANGGITNNGLTAPNTAAVTYSLLQPDANTLDLKAAINFAGLD